MTDRTGIRSQGQSHRARKVSGNGRARQRGLSTVEYAMAGALIGVAIVLAFSGMGKAVAAVIAFIASVFD